MSAPVAPAAAAQPLRLPVEPRRSPRHRGGLVRALSYALLSGAVLLILVATVGMALGVWRFTVIDSGSMRPSLNPGDVAVLTPEPRSALATGQIVAFHPPGEPRLTVLHRVHSLQQGSDGVVMRTKGDANNATDAWHARVVGNTVWRERLKVPMLGHLAVWSGQRPIRFALLVVIVGLFVASSLGAIWRSSPRRTRRRDRTVHAPAGVRVMSPR